MSPTLKILGAGAVLAAGLVAAALPSGASVPAIEVKIEPRPVTADSRLDRRQTTEDACARAVWPHLPQGCLADAGRRVRTIAISPPAAPADADRSSATRVAAR